MRYGSELLHNEYVSDRPYLLISDTQAVYHHQRALEFCLYIQKHYKIPNDHVIHQGDELDLHNASMHPKNPESPHSATMEIKLAQEWVKEWASYFPKMMVCISNHGLRWVRKATHAEIPSQCLRSYKEIFKIPDSWVYKEEWVIPTKHKFRAIHGMGYSGIQGARMAAIDAGMSTSIGHLHSHASINFIRTAGLSIWSMNTGSLIDTESFAFSYGKYNRLKPCIGASVVLNDGSLPIWIPLE